MHQPEPLLENYKCQIPWDFAIQTEKEIKHQGPDIVVIDNERRECKIIITPKHQHEGTRRNQQISGLEIKGTKLWNVKVTVISIVVGALETISEEPSKDHWNTQLKVAYRKQQG